MIPKKNGLTLPLTMRTQPSKTYALDTANGRIRGCVQDKEAMQQAVYLILGTERYSHLIYSWNFGSELKSLIGQPISLVLPEIKRLITEALTQDDRINAVDSFVFSVKGSRVAVTFKVHTIFGEIDGERTVQI